MKARQLDPSCQTLLQAYFAAQALGIVLIATVDPVSLARSIALGAGSLAWLFLAILGGSAALLLLDLMTPRRLRRLTRQRHWLGVGLAFGWAAQAFLAAHYWATGYMALYAINVCFLAVWTAMDAAQRGGCQGGPRDSGR